MYGDQVSAYFEYIVEDDFFEQWVAEGPRNVNVPILMNSKSRESRKSRFPIDFNLLVVKTPYYIIPTVFGHLDNNKPSS